MNDLEPGQCELLPLLSSESMCLNICYQIPLMVAEMSECSGG